MTSATEALFALIRSAFGVGEDSSNAASLRGLRAEDWRKVIDLSFEQGIAAMAVDGFGSLRPAQGELGSPTGNESLKLLDSPELEDTLYGQREEKKSGMRRRVQLILKSLRSGWKYRYFSDQNVLEHVIQRVVGYFEKVEG